MRNRQSSGVDVSADEIDLVATLRALHRDERRRMLPLARKQPRFICGQVDVLAAVGAGDHLRVLDGAMLDRRVVMCETPSQAVDFDLHLCAVTTVDAALLSEGFNLVADGEERGAGVLVEAVELGTSDAVSGWR
jgi:hypothetical protein